MKIVFWNCQGLRPERTELQNHLLENQIDILALSETFLKPKFKFHLPGYDIQKRQSSRYQGWSSHPGEIRHHCKPRMEK